jgi:TolA-binding protein
MKTEQKHIPGTTQGGEFDNLKAWFQKHGSHALTIGLGVLVVVTAMQMLHSRTGRRAVEADRRLAAAQSVEDYESVIRDFGKTDIAPVAVISLAKLHFDNGNYEPALSQYDHFLAKWPSHDMAPVAVLGRVFCIEARNDPAALQEAADAFAAFAAGNPGHYLAPQALFGQARCLEQLGRLAEAQTLYEDFIANHPKSFWSVRAEELLSAVQRRIQQAKPKT